MSLAFGFVEPTPLPRGPRIRDCGQVGTHRGGCFSFQPLRDSITATDPDRFD